MSEPTKLQVKDVVIHAASGGSIHVDGVLTKDEAMHIAEHCHSGYRLSVSIQPCDEDGNLWEAKLIFVPCELTAKFVYDPGPGPLDLTEPQGRG